MTTEYVKCNLCGADNYKFWSKKDGIDIVKCKDCGLIYSNPRLTKESQIEYYSKQYFDEGDYDGDILRKGMYAIEIENQIKKNVGTHGRFLDVGCAYGAFLTHLPDTFEKYAVEFSPQAAEYARKVNGFNVETGELSQTKFPDNYFDVIHFRGVIEHVQDPTLDLKTAFRLLKPKGFLIISTTPNIESLAGRVYREMFRQVFPLEHIYYFSPKTLCALLDKTNFRIVKKYYPYLKTPYENLFKDLMDFILNKFKGTESPPFFKSMMTFYAKKK